MALSLWEQNSNVLSSPTVGNIDLGNFYNLGKGDYKVPDYGGVDLSFGNNNTSNIANDVNDKWTFGQKLFGGKNIKGEQIGGTVSPILGAISSGLQAYLGFKQLGLAEDQLDFAKTSFSKNFEAQRNQVNSRLADRQNARLSANPTAYESVEDYMMKYGI